MFQIRELLPSHLVSVGIEARIGLDAGASYGGLIGACSEDGILRISTFPDGV